MRLVSLILVSIFVMIGLKNYPVFAAEANSYTLYSGQSVSVTLASSSTTAFTVKGDSFDYVKYTDDGKLSASGQYTRSYSVTLYSGQRAVFTNTSSSEVTITSKTRPVNFTASSTPAMQKRNVAPGASVLVRNSSSASESVTFGGLNDYAKYDDEGVLTTFARNDKGGSIAVSANGGTVITNRDQQTFQLIGASETFTFTDSTPASFRETLKTGESLEAENIASKAFNVYYQSEGTLSYEYVVYKADGTVDSSSTSAKSSYDLIGTGKRLVVTNRGSDPLVVIGPYDAFSVTNENNPAYVEQKIQYGESYKFTNIQSKTLGLSYDGTYDFAEYDSTGKVLDFGHDWTGDYSYNSIIANDYVVVTNRNLSPVTVTLAKGAFKIERSINPALSVSSLSPGKSMEALNTSSSNAYLEMEGRYDYALYNATGISAHYENSLIDLLNLRAGERAAFTNIGTETREIYAPYEIFRFMDRAAEVTFHRVLSPGQSLKLDNKAAYAFNVNVDGQHHYATYDENKRVRDYGNPVVGERHSVADSEWMVVTNSGLSDMEVTGAYDAFNILSRTEPALYKGYLGTGQSVKLKSSSPYRFDVYLDGTYDYASYNTDNIPRSIGRKETGDLALLANERATVTNTGNTLLVILSPYDVTTAQTSSTPALAVKTLLMGGSVEFVNKSALSEQVRITGIHDLMDYAEDGSPYLYNRDRLTGYKSISAGQKTAFMNTDIEAIEVYGAYEIFEMKERSNPVTFSRTLTAGSSVDFKNVTARSFYIYPEGTYDFALYDAEGDADGVGRGTDSGLKLISAAERLAMTNVSSSSMIIEGPYDAIKISDRTKPALFERVLQPRESMETVYTGPGNGNVYFTGDYDYAMFTDGVLTTYFRNQSLSRSVSPGERLAVMNAEAEPITAYGAFDVFSVTGRANPVTFRTSLDAGKHLDIVNKHATKAFSLYFDGVYDNVIRSSDGKLQNLYYANEDRILSVSRGEKIAVSASGNSPVTIEGSYDAFTVTFRANPALSKIELSPGQSMEAVNTGTTDARLKSTGTYDLARYDSSGMLDLYDTKATNASVHSYAPGVKVAVQNVDAANIVMYAAFEDFTFQRRENPVTFERTLSTGDILEFAHKTNEPYEPLKLSGIYDYAQYKNDGGVNGFAASDTAAAASIPRNNRIVVTPADGSSLTVRGPFDGFTIKNSAIKPVTVKTLNPGESYSIVNVSPAGFSAKLSGTYSYRTYDAEGKLRSSYDNSTNSIRMIQDSYRLVVINTSTETVTVTVPTEAVMETDGQDLVVKSLAMDTTLKVTNVSAAAEQLSLRGIYDVAVYNSAKQPVSYSRSTSAAKLSLPAGYYAVVTGKRQEPTIISGSPSAFEFSEHANPAIRVVTPAAAGSAKIQNISTVGWTLSTRGAADWVRYDASGAVLDYEQGSNHTSYTMEPSQPLKVTPSASTLELWGPFEAMKAEELEEPALINVRMNGNSALKVTNLTSAARTFKAEGNFMYRFGNEEEKQGQSPFTVSAAQAVIIRNPGMAAYQVYSPYGFFKYEDARQEEAEAISGKKAVDNIRKVDPSGYDPLTLHADPIDTATGAQIMNHTLLTSHAAVPVPFQAQYYSLLTGDGALGIGWSHNYEIRLKPAADGQSASVYWNAFRYNSFVKGADGTYTSSDKSVLHDRLTQTGDGGYVLKRNDGTVYTFAADGTLSSVAERGGMKLVLKYSNAGELASVTEPLTGDGLTFTYNIAGDMVTAEEQSGRKVSFAYDAKGRLTEITDADGHKTQYTYNADDQIVSAVTEGVQLFENTFDTEGRIIKQSDANSASTSFSYEEQDKELVTTITDRNGNIQKRKHNARYELLQSIDALGRGTEYVYDDKGNRTQITNSLGQTVQYTYDAYGNVTGAKDHTGQSVSMTYDENNNLTGVTGPDGKKVAYEYDEKGRLLTTTDPQGNKTSYEYDENGLLLAATDALGNKTTYGYDGGRLKQVTTAAGETLTFGYDQAGRLASQTDEEGNQSKSVYTDNDLLVSYTDPLNRTLKYVYDGQGMLSEETDARGNTTKYRYDGNGNLTQVTNALNETVTLEYDAEGRLTGAVDPLGRRMSFTYDAAGNVLNETNAEGEQVRYVYDELNRLVKAYDALDQLVYQVSYDSAGNPVTIKDGLDLAYGGSYDTLNRLKESMDPLNRKTVFTYDDLNRLTSVTDPMQGTASQSFDALRRLTEVTDPNQNTTVYKYDPVGRVVSETDAARGVHTYRYNAIGLMEGETNKRGQNVAYQYDTAGQLAKFTDPDGSVAYDYDANGNVTTVSSEGQAITRKFDALNRVTAYTDQDGNTIKYAYDAAGQLTTLTYPDGKTVIYTYDGAGRMRTVTDWAGRTTSYAYDKNGRLTSTHRPDGSTESRTYDANGRLLTLSDTKADGTSITDYVFTYDAAGNVISETGGVTSAGLDSVTFDVYGPGLSPAPEAEAGSSVSVSEDVYGPTGPQTDLNLTYTADNRIATMNGEPVLYDADGNMITGPLQGTMQAYTYDSRNRLLEAGGVSYGYNSENGRTSVTVDGVTTKYVINPHANLSQVLMETDENGNVLGYYVYGLGLLGREDASGAYQTYHYDRRGSTVALTDAAGEVTDTYEYGPYGELLSHEGNTAQPFLYNGRDGVMTDANGLYHMRARYYNPETKRFINRDVVTGTIADTPTLNRYAYVNGNPISYVDPFGLSRDSDSWMLKGGDFLVDMIPGVGTLKGFQQAFTGVNLVTGEQLSVSERWAEGIGASLSFIPIPGMKQAGKYGTEGVIFAGNAIKGLFKKKATQEAASTPLRYKLDLQMFGGGAGSPRTFVDEMDASEAARYQRYWEQDINPNYKGAPNTRMRTYATPGTRSIIDQKLSNTGELYERETIYDQFGRRIGNNDYTDHGKPHHHESPHHHPNPWQNPTQHGPNTPGLHPNTPRW
ncbi:RHS repeat-associated core domain-containing protein [Paenibacillus terreus]|uniref:RHS repeat-associated core domain-containing protein n=2 Tax=Paenibacillus terreus TaxID=1387834 RepID=A0ABV5B5E6_9BACL